MGGDRQHTPAFLEPRAVGTEKEERQQECRKGMPGCRWNVFHSRGWSSSFCTRARSALWDYKHPETSCRCRVGTWPKWNVKLLTLQQAGYDPFSFSPYIKKKCFINHRCPRVSAWNEKAIHLPPVSVFCALTGATPSCTPAFPPFLSFFPFCKKSSVHALWTLTLAKKPSMWAWFPPQNKGINLNWFPLLGFRQATNGFLVYTIKGLF